MGTGEPIGSPRTSTCSSAQLNIQLTLCNTSSRENVCLKKLVTVWVLWDWDNALLPTLILMSKHKETQHQTAQPVKH